MRDRFFFPAALVLVVMMVLLALRPGIGVMPTGPVAGDGVNYDKITVAGEYLNKIFAGGDARIDVLDGADKKPVLFIEAEAGALRDEPELGPHFRLAADIETQFSGMTVRITVRARPAEDRGAMQIAMNYAAGRVGESGWKIFDLKSGFQDYSFDYDVPRVEGDQGVDYFGIRPVVPDKSRAVLIEQITFERLGPWKTDEPA